MNMNRDKNKNFPFTYKPQIYSREDWQFHAVIFFLIQVVPLGIAYYTGLSILNADFMSFYYILTGANVVVLLVAIVENLRHARKEKEKLR